MANQLKIKFVFLLFQFNTITHKPCLAYTLILVETDGHEAK